MKRILSIDGGGIRGIIPGMLLAALERRLKRISNNPDAAIADYFDFFAGTSTGGILICLLLCPDDQTPPRPRFSAKEALDIYVTHGSDIFKAGFFRRLMAKFGLLSERYPSATLEHVLQAYFGEIKLSELLKPCIVTAYNIELRKTHFFRQQTAIVRGDSRDFYLRDVCRATSAAPTYFSVAETYSISGTRYPLLDGGVFAPNPSMSALVEVTRAFNETKINDIAILSLGTGRSRKAYDYEHFKKRRAISVGPALIDIMMSGAAESSDFFLQQLYRSAGKAEQYIRIEPSNLHSIHEELDAASYNNIQKLIALGDRMVSENDELLNQLAGQLISEKEHSQTRSPWRFLSAKG
ncbi:patatin-like phospholipase family protein [Parapedobacter sp. ISTM3]|uniref:patatin-like phospholipase family protein n=1 Tax=Parapedobacter sp. ISTM3 TaxID=2800130 RepID=UPI001903EF68|nr:patatin-like phospholipase family protein [Parapedobacter sp. ISTM3]MBK1441424.1 patatin-like phospholipase family protein [Parapedobacter sp. ISTM3]